MNVAQATSLEVGRSEIVHFFKGAKRQQSGCWEWQRSKNRKGYGQHRYKGKLFIAHRFCYAIMRGPIPAGMIVMHECDNPSCVFPGHLKLGTVADNSADMAKKGRGGKAKGPSHGWAKHPEKAPRGSQHGLSKLTEEQVKQIRKIGRSRSSYSVGREFGVSASTIQLILKGKVWTHV